jgi:hypothetical protein
MISQRYASKPQKPSVMKLVLFAFLAGFALPLHAISIEEALTKKVISLKLSSNGNGIREGMITLELSNLTAIEQRITVPAGQLLQCSEDPRQDLIVVKEELLVLYPGKSLSRDLVTMCIEANDSSPGEEISYTLKGMAAGNLLKTAQYIHQHKQHNSAGQSAIWVVSDNYDIGWIDGEDQPVQALRNFMSQTTGKPNPWYATKHKGNENYQLSDQYDRSQPRQETYTMTEAEIKGDFKFKLDQPVTATFGVYDKDGKNLISYFENKSLPNGELSFRFRYRASRIERGTYYARVVSGNRILADQSFTF